MPTLHWLPQNSAWQQDLARLPADSSTGAWQALRRLANFRMGFAESLQLDRALLKRFKDAAPDGPTTKPVRLAILGSSTTDHLLPGIRAGALRRGIWLAAYVPAYGQYLQELLDEGSGLHRFQPNAVLVALVAQHLFGARNPVAGDSADAVLNEIGARLKKLWSTARGRFGCQVIQQTLLPLDMPLLGQNEQRVALSKQRLTAMLNERLREWADAEGVDLLALDDWVVRDGVAA